MSTTNLHRVRNPHEFIIPQSQVRAAPTACATTIADTNHHHDRHHYHYRQRRPAIRNPPCALEIEPERSPYSCIPHSAQRPLTDLDQPRELVGMGSIKVMSHKRHDDCDMQCGPCHKVMTMRMTQVGGGPRPWGTPNPTRGRTRGNGFRTIGNFGP